MSVPGSCTIDRRIEATAGRSTGFDYLRIVLAVAVIALHSNLTSYGLGADPVTWQGWRRPVFSVVLPMFFALSGFLVAGSLVRTRTIAEFALNRVYRIVPALFVEVAISALVLGPVLTALPLGRYFGSGELYRYALNVLGDIHYRLPGLFLGNPDPDMVNRQLWTIPAELRCYIAIIVLYLLGIVGRRRLFLAGVAALTVGFWAMDVLLDPGRFSGMNVPLKMLLLCFLSGVLLYLYKEKIVLNASLFLAACALSYVLLLNNALSYFAGLPVAYMTVAVGLTNPRKTFLLRAGDYSYGIYLYGYPLQQSYSFLFPEHRIWWLNILVCVPVALFCAALSWRFVEAPVLRNRKRITAALRQLVPRPRKKGEMAAPSVAKS